jgi:hypothetical protein
MTVLIGAAGGAAGGLIAGVLFAMLVGQLRELRRRRTERLLGDSVTLPRDNFGPRFVRASVVCGLVLGGVLGIFLAPLHAVILGAVLPAGLFALVHAVFNLIS